MLALVTGSETDERDTYAYALHQVGLNVDQRGSLGVAVRDWTDSPADLVLALRPAEGDLLTLLEGLRALTTAPIILLFDTPSQGTLLAAVRKGCDLALTLPVDPRLVAAYSLNLLRRSGGLPASALPAIEVGGLRLDPASRSVAIDLGKPVKLTQLEFRMLYLLLAHRGHVIPSEDVVERVWGYSESGSRELVRGLVSRLRAKLGDNASQPRFIETIPGVGYRLRTGDG